MMLLHKSALNQLNHWIHSLIKTKFETTNWSSPLFPHSFLLHQSMSFGPGDDWSGFCVTDQRPRRDHHRLSPSSVESDDDGKIEDRQRERERNRVDDWFGSQFKNDFEAVWVTPLSPSPILLQSFSLRWGNSHSFENLIQAGNYIFVWKFSIFAPSTALICFQWTTFSSFTYFASLLSLLTHSFPSSSHTLWLVPCLICIFISIDLYTCHTDRIKEREGKGKKRKMLQ